MAKVLCADRRDLYRVAFAEKLQAARQYEVVDAVRPGNAPTRLMADEYQLFVIAIPAVRNDEVRVVRAIRANSRHEHMPIVVITRPNHDIDQMLEAMGNVTVFDEGASWADLTELLARIEPKR